MDVYLPQLIDQMIQDRAATYAFEKLGLTVTDEEVLAGLMSVYPQFFKDGKLVAPGTTGAALQSQQGMTLAGGVEMMRQQLLLRKLQNMALASVVVTKAEVDQAMIQKASDRENRIHRVSAGEIPRPGEAHSGGSCSRNYQTRARASTTFRKSGPFRC